MAPLARAGKRARGYFTTPSDGRHSDETQPVSFLFQDAFHKSSSKRQKSKPLLSVTPIGGMRWVMTSSGWSYASTHVFEGVPKDEGLAPMREQLLAWRHKPEGSSLLTRNVSKVRGCWGCQQARSVTAPRTGRVTEQTSKAMTCQWAANPPRVSSLPGSSLAL